MYAAVVTRPDIAYAVTFLSQFSSHPGPNHWVAGKRILRYVKGTRQHGLTYARSKSNSAEVICYADTNYASNPKDRRSFLGWCFVIMDCLVSWKTRKHRWEATSTSNTQYMALSEVARGMVWMRQAMTDLKIPASFTLK